MGPLNRLSLRNKFLVIPLIGALTLLLPVTGVWFSMQWLEREMVRLEQQDLRRAERLMVLNARFNGHHARLMQWFRAVEGRVPGEEMVAGERNRLVSEIAWIARQLTEELEGADGVLAGLWQTGALPELLVAYRAEVLAVLERLPADREGAGRHLLEAEGLYHQVAPYFMALMDALRADTAATIRGIGERAGHHRFFFMSAFLLAFLAMVFLAILLSGLLSRDLRAAIGAMRRLARNEREVRLPPLDSSPEVNALVDGLEAFRASLEELDSRALELQALNRELKQEIRDRRLLEKELRLTSCVFEHSREGIMITDVDGHILRVNRAFTRITGWKQEEVVGKTPRLLRSDRHDEEFYRAMWQSLLEEGAWQGEIWNRRRNGEVYPEWRNISAVVDAKGRTTHYISVFADISEKKRSVEHIERLVYHDPLTGLPNRTRLIESLGKVLKEAQAADRKVALLFLDLDRFQLTNDTHGHSFGDRLLQEVADRLSQEVGVHHLLARTGGDEFALVLDTVDSVEEVRLLAGRLLRRISQPMELDGHAVYITASMGISLFPDHGGHAPVLLKNADVAMYRAKERGGDTWQFYEREMHEDVSRRLELETGLRRALEQGELLLHYQPLVDLEREEIVGVEALVRWQHPRFGMVPPDRFIPIAEETGLIASIGKWVTRTACAQLGAWLAAGIRLQRISINLSGREFQESEVVERLTRIAWEEGIPPSHVELEITETFLMAQPEQSIEVLEALKTHGFRLAMDDFGTAYSSLSYLKRFPLDRLKIDRSFIRDIPADPDDVAITQTIIAMARQLGLAVIAEGVETEQQAEFLRRNGCSECQGYLFARPMPAEALTPLLQNPEALFTAVRQQHNG